MYVRLGFQMRLIIFLTLMLSVFSFAEDTIVTVILKETFEEILERDEIVFDTSITFEERMEALCPLMSSRCDTIPTEIIPEDHHKNFLSAISAAVVTAGTLIAVKGYDDYGNAREKEASSDVEKKRKREAIDRGKRLCTLGVVMSIVGVIAFGFSFSF